MNKVPFYFFPFVYIAGKALAMELDCLQNPLTTSLVVLGNLWEVREGTWVEGPLLTCPLGLTRLLNCFRSSGTGPGPEEGELYSSHPMPALCNPLDLFVLK